MRSASLSSAKHPWLRSLMSTCVVLAGNNRHLQRLKQPQYPPAELCSRPFPFPPGWVTLKKHMLMVFGNAGAHFRQCQELDCPLWPKVNEHSERAEQPNTDHHLHCRRRCGLGHLVQDLLVILFQRRLLLLVSLSELCSR